MSQPGSLSFLALDSLGKYVYGLCSRLSGVSSSTQNEDRSKKKKHGNAPSIREVKHICKDLHKLLSQIPTSLANDLSNKLLDNIDNWDFEIGKCKKGSFEGNVCEEMIKAVIHPALTRIESEGDLLDCSDIFQESLFCSSLCANLITINTQHLVNLKALHVLHSNLKSSIPSISLPRTLVEFSGRCNKKLLSKICAYCKSLKYLDVFGSKNVTDACVSILLEMKNLEKLNISQTRITSRGIKRFLTGHYEKNGKASHLKYLAFSSFSFRNFEVFENFPDLKVSVQLNQSVLDPFITGSQLNILKNIYGLQIRTTLHNVNAILRVLGSQLVFLDVEIDNFWPSVEYDDDNDNDELVFNVTDILKVGEYCTALKCLHISFNSYMFPCFTNYQRQPLPGFQTITCLALEIKSSSSKYEIADFLNFLVFQCVNVKKIILEFDRNSFKACDFVCNNIHMGGMKNVELLCFQTFCEKCSSGDLVDYFNQHQVRKLLQTLTSECPSLRVIGINPEFYRDTNHNSQRMRFVPTWCRCK